MKTRLLATLLVLSAAGLSVAVAAESKSAAKTDAVKRHPLRGVVTAVDAERSTLMVKHEEIPGVMRAMTMAFKVDPKALAAVKKGDAVTGLMSRQGKDWVLENVQPAGK